MNTKASVAYGWGVLILAGGSAYYFAKRSINADRSERAANIEKERQRLQKIREAEYTTPPAKPAMASSRMAKESQDVQRDPSLPNNQDPAPIDHVIPRSKYEPTSTFRSRKGDRFS